MASSHGIHEAGESSENTMPKTLVRTMAKVVGPEGEILSEGSAIGEEEDAQNVDCPALLQGLNVKEDAAERIRQFDMRLVSHIRVVKMDADTISSFLQEVLVMILKMIIKLLSPELTDVDSTQAIADLGLNLRPALELILPNEVKNGHDYDTFRQRWD